jgi:hypothetical protein
MVQDTFQSDLKQAYSRDNWQQWLQDIFGRQFNREAASLPIVVSQSAAKSIERFAYISLADGKNMAVLDIVTDEEIQIARNRVALREIALQLIDHDRYHGILALYHSEDDAQPAYRLSFICSEVSLESGELKIKTSAPKRFTYVLGANQNTRTAADRLRIVASKVGNISLDDVKTAFSVEALTKDFYKELFDWYQWAIDERTGVTFPNNTSIPEDDREQIDTKIIRLITRLLFVWFIKQKELVPDKIFDETQLKLILEEFDPMSEKSGNYYNAILQNLFFATLNRAITDEEGMQRGFAKASKKDIKTLYRYEELFSISENDVISLFAKVPFLNGGLFECLDKTKTIDGVAAYSYDGFSRNNTTFADGRFCHRAFVPNVLFFDPQKGLIPILKHYNFTVEENTPQDQQIALDPELLGKVFENLLGVYNPETKETARKQSGSFYTPREIVNYMVDESLKAYLRQKFKLPDPVETNPDAPESDQVTSPDALDRLFSDAEDQESQIDSTYAANIIEALNNVKILDPACGSGAFPMGVLNRIVNVLQKLDGGNDANRIFEQKLRIIENCIYGVDIQPIAIQISKLRFFISLICEQIPNNDPALNYGILPLPNLESKFVAANTLISLNESLKGELDLEDEVLKQMKQALWDIRNHKNLRASSWQEKIKNRKEDRVLSQNIENYLIENTLKPDCEKIEQNRSLIMQYEYQIENLPEIWVDSAKEDTQLSFLEESVTPTLFKKDVNKVKRDQLINCIKVAKAEIAREEKKGLLAGLEAEIKKMTDWDPYDQNVSSPFFDPEWMFGLKDGFDIVIGNPPYVQLQKNGGELSKLYGPRKEGKKTIPSLYQTFDSMGDLYSLFYERGYQLLKQQGRLCFITSNKWMRAGYGENTRNFFVENTNPELLIDFAGVKVFESATVDTNILMFAKDKNKQHTKACIVKKEDIKDLSVFIRQSSSVCKFGSDSWIVLSPIEQRIKAKIEAIGTPLKDWNIKIYRGILTGCNEAFIIDGKKKDELIAKDPKSAEIIRPLLRGRDIKRYGYEFADLFLLFIPWHFPLHENPAITGASLDAEKAFENQYPAIYNHLLKYKKELSARNKAETGIRYEWYALQRWGANYWDYIRKKLNL